MNSRERIIEESEKIMKNFFFHFQYLMLFLIFVNGVLFYIEGFLLLFKMFFYAFFLQFFTLVTIYKLDYKLIIPYVNSYMYILFLGVCYISFHIWTYVPNIFIFFILFPIGAYTIFSKRKVVFWSIASLTAVLFTVFLVDDYFITVSPNSNVTFGNIKIVVSFITIFGFLFYYNIILLKSRYLDKTVTKENDLSLKNKDDEEVIDENEIVFYNELFQQIENYFKINDPWKDSEFNIQDLAYSLQSNTTYISRAINLNAKMNFKNFVNTHRIEFIKTEIQNNRDYNRYKLLYLYSKAGFKHQSTFNKAFKKITGMTPSHYINLINNGSLPIENGNIEN